MVFLCQSIAAFVRATFESNPATIGFASDPFGGSAGSSVAAPADMFALQQPAVSAGVEQGRTPVGWAAGAAAVGACVVPPPPQAARIRLANSSMAISENPLFRMDLSS